MNDLPAGPGEGYPAGVERNDSEQAGAPPAVDAVEGGEPACLLARVCAECGAVLENETSARCERCGTAFDAP